MRFRKDSVREAGGDQGHVGFCRNSEGWDRTDQVLALEALVCKIGYSLPHGERIHEFEVLLNNQI